MNRVQRRKQPSRPAGPTVSACMIVKNEAENLDRCLRSLQGAVDEIIVVDTGSTDATVSVAHKHKAQVLNFEWCDDFAAARNESIRHARSDWVLWLDADEELVEEHRGDLRRLCARPEQPEGYLISCHNLSTRSGDVNSVIRQWRLFRNHLGFRFSGRIHEHLMRADGGTEMYLIFQDDVWVRHWGYLPEPALVERKRIRNQRLLEMALADNPDSPFAHYNLGKQHVAAYEFTEGLPYLARAVELWQQTNPGPQAYVGNMFALAINAAVELGHNQRAIEFERLVPDAVLSPDILFQAGVAWMRLGQREEAMRRFHRAIDDASIRQFIEGDPSSSTWRPLAALAQMHLESGELEQAYDYAKQAQAHGPELPNILFALTLSSARLKRYDEAVGYARKLLELDVNEGYKRQARRLMLNIGEGTGDYRLAAEAFSGALEGISDIEAVLRHANAYAQLGEPQRQYEVLDAGCKQFPGESCIRLALAEVLEAQGYPAEALSVVGAGLDQPDPPPALYTNLARLLTMQGRYEDAANALRVHQSLVSS